jgi:dephospho-CoA kinase
MRRRPIRLALTGSIGMGKSTAAAQLRRLGVPVYDADAAVHALFARGGAAVEPVGKAFPGVVIDGAVDRAKLGKIVFGDPAALKRLEGIVHPLLRGAEKRFSRRMAARGARLLAFDIPLLFETGGEKRYDASIVISAPAFIQEARVMRRPGMTREKLAAIRARQTPDREKRRRADFVVPSALGKRATYERLAAIVRLLRGPRADEWLRARRAVR